MIQSLSAENSLSYLDENYKRVTSEIEEAAIRAGRSPEEIRLMAVTKTVDPLRINRMISLGADLIGENKVQELLSKLEFLDKENAEMHIIGHLQSNKVRKIISTVSMIQSVDSVSLAKEISRQAVMNELTMDCLLEVNIGGEDSKSGISPDDLFELSSEITELPGIRLRGLMCIPPVCDSEGAVRKYFEQTRRLFEDMRSRLYNKEEITVLSMGMSSDFVPAVLEGSTLVRVGSALFGERQY